MALEDAKNRVDEALTRQDMRGPGLENAFGGVTSFLRRRYTKDLTGVDIAVTGIPFDQAVTNRPGARFGPRAIREASTLQAFDAPWGWGFNPFDEFAVVDFGDLAFDYADTRGTPDRIEAHIRSILEQGAIPVSLGGDHFVTLPVLRAMAARHGPLALIHFDAHSDTWADDNPDRIDHGTFLYKAIREGLVDPAHSVSVGIRTDNPDTLGVTILDAAGIHGDGVEATLTRIRDVAGQSTCYLSFDIDVLDPAFAPGTGTPVWGGLASWQAAALLRGLAGINIVGGDVVEVSPPYDTTGATAIAGAHVAVELICLCACRLRGDLALPV